MKKLFLVLILFLPLLFSSCVFMEPNVTPSLGSKIDKTEVSVGEEVIITGFLAKAFHSRTPDRNGYIIYLIDYPENYEIVKGNYYEAMTTEKCLCAKPVPYGSKDFYGFIEGIVKIKMSFSSPGEYTVALSFISDFFTKIENPVGRKTNTYVITVTE